MTEEEIKKHLAKYYGSTDYDQLDLEVEQKLKNLEIIIADQQDHGYDSSAYFIFREKTTEKLFEMYASHCSCYGFENQFDLEETSEEFLLNQKKYWSDDDRILDFLKNWFKK